MTSSPREILLSHSFRFSDGEPDYKEVAEAESALNEYYLNKFMELIGEDEPLNKAHETNECPGCNVVERNELRAELREATRKAFKK